MLSGPPQQPQEQLVVHTMKMYLFNFSGFERSYWDFYRGFGWFLAVQLAAQAIIFWYLASLAKAPPAQLRPISIMFAINFLAMAAFSLRYFTLGPIVIETLFAVCLVGGIIKMRPEGIV